MPGFPVLHYLPEFAQTHVHCIGFVIHLILCHPLLLLPSVLPNIRIFSNESALHIRWPKYWSFSFSISPSNEYSGWFPLGLTGLISLLSKRVPRIFSNTTVWKHQFFGTHFYGPTLTSIHDYWKKHSFDYIGPLSAKWCLCFLILCIGLS